MNESRERIRRERERARTAATAPRHALRRVLLLAEGRQFREAAALLARLARAALAPVAADLPLDLLADALPHSAVLIETLLNRLVELDVTPRPALPCEALAWRLAAQLGAGAGGAGAGGEAARLAGAARALARFAPDLPAAVDARRRQLDAAVHGLGTHGLTAGGAEGELVSLHAALRDELQAHLDAYKQALHKIQELSAVTAVTAPAASSHQRLLALPASDVERRLIDNASLLASVRRAPPRLPALLAALDARVASDKQVLAAAGLVRRADPRAARAPPNSDTRPVAGVLMSYSRGCATLLALMAEGGAAPPPPPTSAPAGAATPPAPPAPRSPPDSASDGYHSDSDHMPERCAEVAAAVACYGACWARAAGRWLPALAALPALARAPSLPHKIVFSVVVLSFRAAISLRDKRLNEVKELLGVGGAAEGEDGAGGSGSEEGSGAGEGEAESGVARLTAAATRVLRAAAHRYPLHDAERTVITQVSSTLREYSGLAESAALRALTASACRAAWRLALHSPPLRLDTDFTATRFDPEKHVRWCAGGAEAGARGDAVKSFVWPALMDGPRCLFRAVVLT